MPEDSVRAAVARLDDAGLTARRVSPFLKTKAFPPSDQPDFVNAVLLADEIAGPRAPDEILAALHRIERDLGRVREVPWGPRPIDLDLLAVGDLVTAGYWEAAARGDKPGEASGPFILPHPRLHLRRFVLEPLCAIAPEWRHPALGMTASALLARLDTETAG
jgi:2-amino-4-hydroxy-6-hydroxymethyldihydropteridine diphosphokinase